MSTKKATLQEELQRLTAWDLDRTVRWPAELDDLERQALNIRSGLRKWPNWHNGKRNLAAINRRISKLEAALTERNDPHAAGFSDEVIQAWAQANEKQLRFWKVPARDIDSMRNRLI